MAKPPLLLSLNLLFLILSATAFSASTPSPSPTAAPSPPRNSSTTLSPSSSPATPTPAPAISSTLDPKQLTALQSLNIPTGRDPCTNPTLARNNVTLCDASSPFRHLVALRLANCSDDVALSLTALRSLSTLQSLRFDNCPIATVRFPPELALNLRSFSAVRSLRRLTGVWLSRLLNLTELTVTDVAVNASGPFVVLGNMRKLTSVTISRANLTGNVPRHLNPNLTYIDLSGNRLRGRIPSSINRLENLHTLNLSGNQLAGEIPTTIGDLISLKNLSLASNSLTGPVPETISAIPNLVHVDLSFNQLNGSIPRYFTGMKTLRYLNLGNNNFRGVMPFNASFISRLAVFRVAGNDFLCYNRSVLSSKMKLGIAPCDRHGFPMSPPPAKGSAEDDSSDYDDDGDSVDQSSHKDSHHGPNKVVLGVASGLSSIVFLIIFLVLLSKCCR